VIRRLAAKPSTPSIVGIKSSATVQQIQPFASSTMFSAGQVVDRAGFRISPSTTRVPNSLTSNGPDDLEPAFSIR